MANDDLDLEVKATSVWDYLNENKKAKDIFAWCWNSFLSPKGKKIAIWMVVLVFLSSMTGVVKAYSVKMMIDGLSIIVGGHDDKGLLLEGFVSMALLILGGRVIGCIKNCLQEYFFADFHRELRQKVSWEFFEKPLGLHVSENTILNADNIKKGYDRAPDLMHNIVIEMPDLVFAVILPFIMLWSVNLVVVLLMALVMAIHLSLSGYLNYRAMVEGFPIEKMWRSLYRYIIERWRHIERVKNNAKELDELSVIDSRYQKVSTLDLKLWISYIIWSLWRGFICSIVALSAVYYGLHEIWTGKLSLGYIYPLIALSMQILDNLWQIGSIERKIHYNLHSTGMLKEALAIPSNISVTDNVVILAKDSPCRVQFDSVSYRFKNKEREPQVLNNISFTIEPKEKVALIGTSGAGKSTLMKLLLRYMDPTTGSIRIDGADLRDIESDSWLDLVGYIPQEAQILNGTMRYNIKYNVPSSELKNITDEYVWEQMRMLQVDFGERLTDGLETRLGYNGIELSGGQKQRLMILAAAMKNPRFMIIDEATSSLDSSTEKLVQAGLEKVLDRNCGALIVAHRLSSVRRICNKFVVIEPDGLGSKVAGIGRNFEELFDCCPAFIKLARDQEIKI
jgi:ABC-type multidrug transport system fused ATPase/permease subunit